MDITKTELQVLQVVWKSKECSSNHIVESLQKSGDWHEKTVKTLLGRLVKKGAVGFVKSGRGYQYHALIPERDYQQKESDSFIKRVFGGRISPFVATFAKQDKLSQSDIDELKAIIDQWENDRD